MRTLSQQIDDLESEEQRRVVREYSRCVVLARPGSGKTYTIVLKIAYLLGHVISVPQKVARITYMNDAVSEISERLEKLGIEDEPRLLVGTLHKFCFSAILQPFKNVFLQDLPSPLVIADEEVQIDCWQEVGINNKSKISELREIQRN